MSQDKHLGREAEGGEEDDYDEDDEVPTSSVAGTNGSVRRDSGIDFSDDGANGGLSHEEEDPSSKAKSKKKHKGKGGNNCSKKPGKEVEFKSGMIFNLEM